jgi:hypothetical protein
MDLLQPAIVENVSGVKSTWSTIDDKAISGFAQKMNKSVSQ